MDINMKNGCGARPSVIDNMNYNPANVASSSYPIDEILDTSEPSMNYVPYPVSPYDPTNPSMQRLDGEDTNTDASFVGVKRPYFVANQNQHASQQKPRPRTLDLDVRDESGHKTMKKPRKPRRKKSDIVEPVKAVAAAEGVTTLLPPSYFA